MISRISHLKLSQDEIQCFSKRLSVQFHCIMNIRRSVQECKINNQKVRITPMS